MSSPTPDEIRDTARDIVSGREYTEHESLIARIRDALSSPEQAAGDLVEYLGRLLGGNEGGFAAVIAWVITLAIAGVIVFLVVRLVHGGSYSDVVPVAEPRTTTVTKKDLIDEAEQFEKAGDWRQAIRSRHAALVAFLDDKNVLRRETGMTAREYYYVVARNAPAIGASFADATSLFERAWYSDDTPRREDVDDFVGLAADVEKRVLT